MKLASPVPRVAPVLHYLWVRPIPFGDTLSMNKIRLALSPSTFTQYPFVSHSVSTCMGRTGWYYMDDGPYVLLGNIADLTHFVYHNGRKAYVYIRKPMHAGLVIYKTKKGKKRKEAKRHKRKERNEERTYVCIYTP